MNMSPDGNNRMMTEMTIIDKKGNGRHLATDGVINQKQTFKMKQANKNIGFHNWKSNIEEDSFKEIYGYADKYDYYNETRRYSKLKKGLETSLFDQDQLAAAEFSSAKQHTTIDAEMYEFKKYKD